MTIHREGKTILLVLLIILVVLNIGAYYIFPGREVWHDLLSIASIVFFLLILQFFRNPKVVTEVNEKHIIAPADGKVVAIEDVDEPEYFGIKRRQISIFMSPVNVHVNRLPVSGKISYVKYHKGKYLVAWHPKSSTDNERTTIVIRLNSGLEILVRQIAGALAKRIKYYIKEGDEVTQGQEFGFIKFGSRVDVLLPPDTKILVQIGDKTRAGKTTIAQLAD